MNFGPDLDNFTGVQTTWPVASTGVTLTAGAANTYGNYGEVIAAAGVATEFRIACLSINTPSAAFVGKVEIAYGAGGAEVPVIEVPVEVATDAGFYPTVVVRGEGGVIPAGSRVAARFKTVGGATTANVLVGVVVR